MSIAISHRPAVASFEGVALAYELDDGTSLVAVEDASFDIRKGEFVCVVGPSGCGKSTLLMALLGLVQPVSGTITTLGNQVLGPGSDRALVFQQASLLPWRSIIRNVAYGLEVRGVRKKEAADRARSMLSIVGLEGFEERRPAELSGGMMQRANLARALVLEPELLLLDEPFAALDAQTREKMQGELLSLWERTGCAAVFITHQIDEAVYLADRVVVLSRRPSRVVKIHDIDLERPRELDIKMTAHFRDMQYEIWKSMQ